jgi:DNA-binding transcriptional MerR regulator
MLADYPEILSTSDVAKIFNRKDYTIRDWERKGMLINVAEDATEDKGTNSNGHRKRRQSLLFRKSDIIKDTNLRAMLAKRTL